MADLVLVTGATGFLGGNLARELVERGASVRVLTRGGRRPIALDGREYAIAEGDVCDPRAVAKAAAGCRYVYHAAADLTFWCPTPARFEAVRRVNVDGTRTVLGAAAAAGVERVVHVSTIDAVGVAPPGQLADEDTDWPPGRVDGSYAETKREAEEVARRAEVPTVIVNPAYLLGPYDPKPSSGRLLLPLALPVVVYPSRGGNNFVDVRAVVAATIAAMERGEPGRRYILGGVNLTYRELYDRALAVLGRRPFRVPAWPVSGWLASLALAAAGRVTGREPFLPPTLARQAFMERYYTSARAERELGLGPTDIETTLRDSFDWYRRQGWIR